MGICKIFESLWELLCGKIIKAIEKLQDEDLNLEQDTKVFVHISLNQKDPDKVIKTASELLKAQRLLENTHARIRLEKWVTRIIVDYLMAVGIVVIFNGFHYKGFNITDKVLIVILTTTTINILGLGFIVLRGHFTNGQDANSKNSISPV